MFLAHFVRVWVLSTRWLWFNLLYGWTWWNRSSSVMVSHTKGHSRKVSKFRANKKNALTKLFHIEKNTILYIEKYKSWSKFLLAHLDLLYKVRIKVILLKSLLLWFKKYIISNTNQYLHFPRLFFHENCTIHPWIIMKQNQDMLKFWIHYYTLKFLKRL